MNITSMAINDGIMKLSAPNSAMRITGTTVPVNAAIWLLRFVVNH